MNKLAYWLTVIGGLNWGLIGLIKYDAVNELLGGGIARIVYLLVGLSALWMIFKKK